MNVLGRTLTASFVLITLSSSADAAPKQATKDEILALCGAAHNMCLVACNASITPGPGSDFLHWSCESGCNDAEIACQESALQARQSTPPTRRVPINEDMPLVQLAPAQ